MKPKLPRYKISIDQSLSDNGEELGITQIAYVENPAIMTKGVYFTEAQKMEFKDKLKMRVAAPCLIPDLPIYRFDEEIGEYEVIFDIDTIEKLVSKFKRNKVGTEFNLDHNEDLSSPSYILNDWFVEDSKTDISFTKYGVKVPVGSWFVVSQFTDEKFFQEEIINKDRAAYSIEGFLGLALAEIKQKLNKEKMEKVKFEMAKLADGTPVWISTMEVGGEVFTVDENMERAPIFDGEHELEDGTKLVTVDGKITEVIAKAEDAPVVEDAPADEVAVTAAEDAPVVEETPAEGAIDEAMVIGIVQPKLDEIYSVIAELKTMIEAMNITDATTEDIVMSQEEKFKTMLNKLKEINA